MRKARTKEALYSLKPYDSRGYRAFSSCSYGVSFLRYSVGMRLVYFLNT